MATGLGKNRLDPIQEPRIPEMAGADPKLFSDTRQGPGIFGNAADALMVQVDCGIGGHIVVGAVFVGIDDANRDAKILDRWNHAHARRITKREDEENIYSLLFIKGAGGLGFFPGIYELRRDDLADLGEMRTELFEHAHAHLLELPELVPVVEVSSRKKTYPRSRHSGSDGGRHGAPFNE
jgi:hypothetical protein